MNKDMLNLSDDQLQNYLDEIEITKETLNGINVPEFCKRYSAKVVLQWAKRLSVDRYFGEANKYLEEIKQNNEVKKESIQQLMENYKALHDSMERIAFMLNPNPLPELMEKYTHYKNLYNQQ